MFVDVTPNTLITDILAATDQESYGLFGNASAGYSQLVSWINNETQNLWQWGRRLNRDAFTSLSSSFTISSGNSISMTAASPAGVGITDWMAPRGVDVQFSSSVWSKIGRYNFTTRNNVGFLSYRFLGDTMYIEPADLATTYTYRVWYMTSAPVADDDDRDTAMSLPEGADDYIVQGVAAKIRIKLDDDPSPHLLLQKNAEMEIKSMLQTSGGDQGTIADVRDDVGVEYW
jgi:hypothetical protein